jgi:DNA-binding transcriptional regulator YiaG
MKKGEIKGFCGLNYLTLRVPLRKSKFGDVIDMDPKELEKSVAAFLLLKRVPIRGAEVKFFRKVLGLSMNDFGRPFELTSSAIHKWESVSEKHIGVVNEIAVRIFVATELGVTLKTRYRDLVAVDHQPVPIEMAV